MQATIFLGAFLLAPVIMLWLLKVAKETPNRISLITVVVYSVYLFSVVGTFPLFFMLDEYRVATGVIKKEVVLYVLLYSIACIVFLLMGVIFARQVLKIGSQSICSLNIKKSSSKRTAGLIVALCFIVMVLCLYLTKIDSIAIIVALKGSVVDATLARSEMGNNLEGGGAHWYSLILNNIGSLVTCAILATWLMNKERILFALFFISFAVSFFIAVMATEKAPLINLMTSILITYYLVKNNGVIPLRKFLYFGVTALVILVYLYMLFMGSPSPTDAFQNIISRAFSGSITPAYFYLEFYPKESEYLFGQTFPNPGGILPYTPVRYTVDMMNWVFPELVDSGVVGTMPTVFWGEAYVNFGWAGIPIVSFIVGFVLSIVVYLMSHIELNPITIALNVWLIDHYKRLSITGFSGYLYDFYFFGVAIFVMVLMFLTGPVVIKTKNQTVGT